jgi:hypothetical protein
LERCDRRRPRRYDAQEAGRTPLKAEEPMGQRVPSFHLMLTAALLFLAVTVRIADP